MHVRIETGSRSIVGVRWPSTRVALGWTIGIILSARAPLTAAESPPWLDLNTLEERSLTSGAERLIVPQRYRTVQLDWAELDSILQLAPRELSAAALDFETVLTLPLADGAFGRFRIEESPIMEADLAARLPEVKTYRGFGLDDPSAFVRFDTTPTGFHALIRSQTATTFIDPYARGETSVYLVYDERDFVLAEADRPVCRVGGEETVLPAIAHSPSRELAGGPQPVATSGATFKQIDLAVAATGEYTGFHGGTVAAAQAAIITTINRVNVVYEHDLAIRMNLIDNTAIVYTNPATDPYSNSCTSAELSANQANLDAVIGAANYDLGHVMGGPGGGGGLAGVGPCLRGLPGNSHARGCTGTSTPVGDPFDIDFVAHEIGHQWGAPHTFNGTVSNCGGGNRSSGAAYEPGSGSTIMAYAGICGSDNLQNNSDDYFHGSSLETIAGYDPTRFGAAQCISMTASGNTPPTAGAGVDREIPKNTPFTLCGTGTDPDAGDSLTYLWEEYDLGPDPGGPPNNASSAPFFRSFDPTTSNCRTFPKLADILANAQTNGEILPNVAWPMTFRLTVFDNHPGAVGGGFDQDEVNVTVSGTSGPFQITAPNTAVTWTGNTTETVTWDVASTTSAPINCSQVDILFSSDGGATFPTVVAANTPNDGSQTITVPNVTTTTARLEVNCSDNVFFDINNADFNVNAGAGCTDDAFEGNGSGGTDDTCFGADLGSLPAAQTHLHCDEDWVFFAAAAGKTYAIETSALIGGSDTTLSVQKSCGPQLAFDNDSGVGLASRLEWTTTTAGSIDVRVGQFGDAYGSGKGYDITVAEICPVNMKLSGQTVSSAVSFVADDNITTGPGFTVDASGSASLTAGSSVILGAGTAVAGQLTVTVTPSPCP